MLKAVTVKEANVDLFAEDTAEKGSVKTLTYELYQKLLAQLGKQSKDAILPIQTTYFSSCGLYGNLFCLPAVGRLS